MTSQRDWLWRNHTSFKPKKQRDWLDLNQAVVRETTRFGEKKLHVRNYPESFRELRRIKRTEKAQQKFIELSKDQNNVIGNASRPGDFIKREAKAWGKLPKGPNLSLKEAKDLLQTSHQLNHDVGRLVCALSGSTGQINTLWRVIETVGLIGRFMGTHPLKAWHSANAREPWWHEPAISRAMEIRQKHPDPKKYRKNRIAGDVYRELKDKQDGPASVGAVNKVLERKLWTTGVSPIK
jgi:hypothetical protein